MPSKLYFGSILESVLVVVTVAVVASVVTVAVSRRRGTTGRSIVDRLLVVWLVAALGVVAVLTLQPGPHGFDGALPQQLNPLYRVSLSGARSNTLLYVPVGFVAALVLRSKTRPVVWATGLAFSVSLGVEVAQLVLPISRAAEVHDIVFNTFGGFVGALGATFLIRLAEKSERHTGELSQRSTAGESKNPYKTTLSAPPSENR